MTTDREREDDIRSWGWKGKRFWEMTTDRKRDNQELIKRLRDEFVWEVFDVHLAADVIENLMRENEALHVCNEKISAEHKRIMRENEELRERVAELTEREIWKAPHDH